MNKIRRIAEDLGFEITYETGIDIATGLYGLRVIRTA